MDPMDRFSTQNQRIPGWAAVCLAFLLLAPAPGRAQSPGSGAPPALGKSPRDRAVADSLMNHYVVKSPYGRFEAHGDAMLFFRINVEQDLLGQRGETGGAKPLERAEEHHLRQ